MTEPTTPENKQIPQALPIPDMTPAQWVEALMFYYNRYRGIKAFLLDHYRDEVAFKGISTFLKALSPDTLTQETDPIASLHQWILETIKRLNNPNLTLVISCPASQLYRFADIVDLAQPPLAHIDFAPLHEFEEIVADARLKYDMIQIEQEVLKLTQANLGE